MAHEVPLNITLPTGKAEFNLEEAAGVLGISSNELRDLVAGRLAGEDKIRNLGRMKFRPADLIMLTMVHSTARSMMD